MDPLTRNLLIGLAFLVIGLTLGFIHGKQKQGPPPKPKRPLTPNEQALYFRLKDALPDAVILAQVSFGAILRSKTQATRNRFSQKVVDFVLCDRGFNVIAIIELDDSSHNGKGPADKARDAMLSQAGYKVLRWRRIPDVAYIRKEFATLVTPAPIATPAP